MQQYEVYEFYENADVIRLCSFWKDDIDGECLQRAVVRAMKRYPYLKVRLALHREELTIQPNFEEIPIYHKSRGLKPLGSKGSGYHLLSIDYDGNCFAFNICHQIVDGNTAHQVLRTIAYAYA